MDRFVTKITKIEKMVTKLLSKHSIDEIRSQIEGCSLSNLLSVLVSHEVSSEDPPRKTKKRASKKVAGGVKKNVNSWIHFCSQKRPELKERGITGRSATTELAKMWGSMTIEEKQEYKDMADQDKVRYEQQSVESKVGESEETEDTKETQEEVVKKPRKKAAKVVGGIKKNVNSWIHFCNEKRPELKERGITGRAATTELAGMWGNMTVEEKQEYKDMADQDKLRYEQATAESKVEESTDEEPVDHIEE